MGRGPDLKPRKKTGRAGPGRPAGIPEALPRGAVAATKVMKWSSPRTKGLDETSLEYADEAFKVYVDVMRAENPRALRFARERLTAAKMVREEVCGAITQRHEHSGAVQLVVATGFQGEPGYQARPEGLEEGEE